MLVVFETGDGPIAVNSQWVAKVTPHPNGRGIIRLGFDEGGNVINTTEPFDDVVAKLQPLYRDDWD